jgi:hypothetical protein
MFIAPSPPPFHQIIDAALLCSMVPILCPLVLLIRIIFLYLKALGTEKKSIKLLRQTVMSKCKNVATFRGIFHF